MAKVIRFPVERRKSPELEKNHWFKAMVDEILTGIDECFKNYDIFPGQHNPARKK